jgi:hypothetical protein
MRAIGQVAAGSARRRARYARAFMRLPHSAIEHQVPEWFLDWSKKSHWQASFPQAFTRDQEPSAMVVTTVPTNPARKPSTPRAAGSSCQVAAPLTDGTNVDRRAARFIAATRSRWRGRSLLASPSARIPSRTAMARRCASFVTFSPAWISPAAASQSCSCRGVPRASVPASMSLVFTNSWTRRSAGLGAGSGLATVTRSGYHQSSHLTGDAVGRLPQQPAFKPAWLADRPPWQPAAARSAHPIHPGARRGER